LLEQRDRCPLLPICPPQRQIPLALMLLVYLGQIYPRILHHRAQHLVASLSRSSGALCLFEDLADAMLPELTDDFER
jgi:hypothetical protein